MNRISQAFRFSKTFVLEHKRISAAGVVLLLAAIYFLRPEAAAETTIQLGRATTGTVSEVISGVGEVSATSQVELKPKVNANVTQVLVGPGDKVYKGQVLFRLDARDAYKQVRDAQLSLQQAQVALEKLKQPADTIDILTIENAIKKLEMAKVTQDTNVANAYSNLLTSNLVATPDLSYTVETAPTISGTYTKSTEGQIRINIGQGTEGTMLPLSGIASGFVQYGSSVAQPIGDTGLYLKFNAPSSQVNWIIEIPNKRSSSYSSLLNSYNTAKQNRDIANADTDRQIAEYRQKLEDLKRGAKEVDLTAQELSVQQRQNSLNDANNTLADYTIVAPFAGTMASVSAQVGLSAVTAASNGATSLGTIVTDQRIAEITLNESDISKIHLGQPAKVSFDAIDGLSATGTVADIDGLGTVTQGVVTYKVKVSFDLNDVRIKPSMSVSVDIITNSKANVLVVPTTAIKRDTTIGDYVEVYESSDEASQGGEMMRNSSSTRQFNRASSTMRMGTTSRMGNGSTTPARAARSLTVPSSTVFTKVPVVVGVKGDSTTEVISGLTEGQQIIVKKTTAQAKTASQAPSITSLFRPGGSNARTGATGTAGAGATQRPTTNSAIQR